MTPRGRKGAAGFSTVELLVAAALGSVVLGAALALLRAHVLVARRAQAELAAIGGSSWALGIASRDLELAGADPTGAGVAGLRAATATRVEIEADLDGDGRVDGASAEDLQLSWSAASGGRLLRRVGNQSMNVAAPVPRDGLRLRYFDGAGVEVAPGAAGLDASDLSRVRRVRVELAVREPFADSGLECRLSTDATPRSRVFTEAP